MITATGPLVDSPPLIERRCAIGDVITFTVEADSQATGYEFQIEHIENHIIEQRLSAAPTAAWSPTRAGHFVVRGRALSAAGPGAWEVCTDSGYWLFAWIKAPEFGNSFTQVGDIDFHVDVHAEQT